MAKVIAYAQLGGMGSRLFPLTHQPGMRSRDAFTKRGLLPHNHNSYFAVAKPVLPYFEVSLSEPLIKRAAAAGIKDIRGTILVMPETVTTYYGGRNLGNGISVGKLLYESSRLDTAGGIVRDVAAGLRDGSIKNEDTILVLGGDIRTDLDISAFLELHKAKNADITIALADVPREEMYRFGAAVREGDKTPQLGSIEMRSGKDTKNFPVYGQLNLNDDDMAKIVKFFEKAPKLDPSLVVNPGELDIQEIFNNYGIGALAPTTLQNASIYAIRAELMDHLAPLVFNVPPTASCSEWAETTAINLSGKQAFSDFGGHWFMALTGSKPLPEVDEYSPVAEAQKKIIDDLQKGLPQVYGYKHRGQWSDDGTLPSVLQGHFEILVDLIKQGPNASWPIDWSKVRSGYPRGMITMSDLSEIVGRVEIIPPVFIGEQVSIVPGAKIGPFAIIGRGWEVAGKVENSILFPRKRIDADLESLFPWNRFRVPETMTVTGSLIGAGFEEEAVDHKGNRISTDRIENSVLVSNGTQNVISPIDI